MGASRRFLDKCKNYGREVGGAFMRPEDAKAAGLYVYFEVFGERGDCGPGEARLRDRRVLMFGSNDYLDLTNDPRVKEAARRAVSLYGTGCSGSRLLNGTLDLHVRLEDELAEFVHKDDALTFGTGFQANCAALSALSTRGDVVICDHNAHASLMDGILRTPARSLRFRHNDIEHLEFHLRQSDSEEKSLIVSEGVFSMEGDLGKLRDIVRLAREYGACTYVDEAHSLGVFGPTGVGVAEHLGVLQDVDIIMGTFSKSLASIGGFVAADRDTIQYVKHVARPFVFSASVAPASAAAALAALDIIRGEPERRTRLLATARRLRAELKSRRIPILGGEGPIVPVVVEDGLRVMSVCRRLLDDGIYVNPVLRPAATHDLLRISCTSAHSDAQVDRLVHSLSRLLAGEILNQVGFLGGERCT